MRDLGPGAEASDRSVLAVVLRQELGPRGRVLAFRAVHDRLVRSRTLLVGIVRQGLYIGGHAIWTKHAV